MTAVYINLRQQWNKVSDYCVLSSEAQYYFLDLHFCNFSLVILLALGTSAPNLMRFQLGRGIACLAFKNLSEFMRTNQPRVTSSSEQGDS